MTDDEIARELKIPIRSASGRAAEMRASGHLVTTKRTRKTEDGKPAVVSVYNPDPQPLKTKTKASTVGLAEAHETYVKALAKAFPIGARGEMPQSERKRLLETLTLDIVKVANDKRLNAFLVDGSPLNWLLNYGPGSTMTL